MAKKKPNEEDEMSFFDHLSVFRGTLFRSAIAITIGFFIVFLNREFVFDNIVFAPKSTDFITYKLLCKLGYLLHIKDLCLPSVDIILVNTELSGQFTMHFFIAFVGGMIIAMPYIVWELWRFISPALSPKEISYSRGAVIIISLLFFIGVLFSYFVSVPWAINFLASYKISASVDNLITIDSYISSISMLILSGGLIFEMPLIVYFLSKVGIVTPALMKKYRRYAIVVIFIIAAIITPPDVFSQCIMAIPLLLLYEISILVSKRVFKKKQKEDKND